MKSITRIALSVFLTLSATAAFATDFARGTVTKIDDKQKKITIKHEELKNLGMSAMTMVFAVADAAMLDKVKEGQAIEFVADRVNGRLTVTEIK